MRIVSLLPSTTEILFALGAGDEVVGVTFECSYPAQARTRLVVSTTTLAEGLTPAEIDAEVRRRVAAGEDLYHLDADALRDLEADLVVSQDLCAVCAIDVSEVEDALAYLGCRAEVLTVDPHTLEEVFDSIATIGAATAQGTAAASLLASLRARVDRVTGIVARGHRPRLAVLEWTDPAYSAGHWIPDMVTAAGATPALSASGGRSVPVSWDQVAASQADAIVVAPCGYGLAEAAEQATSLIDAEVLPPGVAVWAVDADAAFVRPGPRLVDGIEALAHIAHPDLVTSRPEVARQVRPDGCR